MNSGHRDRPLTGWDLNHTGRVNPFPPTAVAKIAEFDDDTVTVYTPTVREAVRVMDDYLAAPTAKTTRTSPGNVLAIVGDYGTGKTHLAVELLRHARNSAGDTTGTLYLDAPADTFVTLYRRFVQQLDAADVNRRVSEYYADVIADALSVSEFTSEVSRQLRAGELDPVEAVDRLSLMESRFLQQVQITLHRVTRNEAFGTALTLLLRRGFADAVWEWLAGHAPDQILMDRGIDAAINNETAALEAMGVFALLYGHRNHRFVVVIDELDKLLSVSSRPTEDAVVGFKKLLEVFAAARALLVLVGLPDYLDVLGIDVLQRIGRIIRVSALTSENTSEFISRTQQRTLGKATLEPFTPDTVNYLVKLTDGAPRKVVRLCHHLYRKATDEGTQVTESMVRQVARTQFDFASIDKVRGEVRRVLDAHGLSYFPDHQVGRDPYSLADYWIPVGDLDSGCAVLLTESVLDATDSEALTRRAMSIHNAVADAETVLVVVGYLPSGISMELSEAFRIEPIVYDHWIFGESLAAILTSRVRSIEEVISGDPLVVLHDRVERMNRQQSNTQRFIERLAIHVDDMRASSDHRLGVIQRGLDEITNALYSRGPAGSPSNLESSTGFSRLPAEVRGLFNEAMATLDALNRMDIALRDAFVGTEQEPSQAVDARMNLRATLYSPNLFHAMGVAILLQKLVEAFRNGVNDWYRSREPNPQGKIELSDRVRLDALCRAYEALFAFLPAFRLNDLEEFPAHPGGRDDQLGEVVRSTRLTNVQDVFSSLGVHVHKAVLKSFSIINDDD